MIPNGYLDCDGSAVSRTTYSKLFAVLGTTWGAGDGSTTFNLPDLRSRFAIGSGPNGANNMTFWGSLSGGEHNMALGELGGKYEHTLTIEEMPAHAHRMTRTTGSGANTTGTGCPPHNGTQASGGVADTNTMGGGKAHKIVPAYACVRKLIRYE